jgi:hypothetical protein
VAVEYSADRLAHIAAPDPRAGAAFTIYLLRVEPAAE